MYLKVITAIQGCEKGNIEQSLGKWKKNIFQYMKKTLYLNVATELEGMCKTWSHTEKKTLFELFKIKES